MNEREFRLSPVPVAPVEKEREDGASHPPACAEASAGRPREAPAGARVRCPVCDGSGEEPSPGTIPGYVRCEGCGTLFLKKRPSLGELARARNELFKRAFALPLHEERRRSHDQAVNVMRNYFKVTAGKPAALNAFGKSLLELECGLGLRLRAFQSYGWTVSGMETGATAFEYARRQTLDVKHGWFAQEGYGRASFDVVLFCGSFGSLPDPRRAVERTWELLKRGGLVCVMEEPLVQEGEEVPSKAGLFVYAAESLKRLFCEKRFSFISEEIGEDAGTFWFKANVLSGCAAGDKQ